jgi:MFS transporter, DHA3 family, macrolide efflux protein
VATVSPPVPGFRSVLRNRRYLLWLASSNTASVGYSVYAISVVWLTYVATHNYLVIGVILFVEYATYAGTFLVAPFVDRVRNQRTIYLICYPIQAAAAAALGVAGVRGELTVPLLVGLLVVISVLWDLSWAAYQAAPRLLLAREELFAAGGVGGAIGGANSIAGYAVGGVLILVVGAAGGMFLYAALLLVGAALAIGLTITPGAPEGSSFGESFRDGWRALSSEPGRPLLQLASVDAVQGFFTAGAALFVTLISVRTFATSAGAYGALFTVYVVGGVAAGLVLGRLNPRKRAGLVMVASLLAGGAAFAAVGALPAALLGVAVLWLAVGFFLSAYSDAKYSFLRGSVEPAKLGRVTSNLYLFPGISSAVGALVLGELADRLPPLEFGLVLGAGFLAAGALAVLLPGVRILRY